MAADSEKKGSSSTGKNTTTGNRTPQRVTNPNSPDFTPF